MALLNHLNTAFVRFGPLIVFLVAVVLLGSLFSGNASRVWSRARLVPRRLFSAGSAPSPAACPLCVCNIPPCVCNPPPLQPCLKPAGAHEDGSKSSARTQGAQKLEKDLAGMRRAERLRGSQAQPKITLHDPGPRPLLSSVHCVGESFLPRGWVHRSCEFRNLCFDLTRKDFVLFRPPAEHALSRDLSTSNKEAISVTGGQTVNIPLFFSPTAMGGKSVSIGGVNPRWNWEPDPGIRDVEWFPRLVDGRGLSGQYYTLDDPDVVMILFHSMAALNIGHMMWDDLLPIFNLFKMFNYEHSPKALVRMLLPKPLWATCEDLPQNLPACNKNFAEWLPLMGFPAEPPPTSDTVWSDLNKGKSNYVCMNRALAGLGLLTDHGMKDQHGRIEAEYATSVNLGRGPMLYDFRTFMIENVNLRRPTDNTTNVVFSAFSSTAPTRSLSFVNQSELLTKEWKTDSSVTFRTVLFDQMSAVDQLSVAMSADVLMTAAGGGAVTAMFMGRGSSVILYYDDTGQDAPGFDYPARLDWDYFNNCAYLRSTWLPLSRIDEPKSLETLKKVVRAELEAQSAAKQST